MAKGSSRCVLAGFYGKLPTHGDFVHRGVRDEFLNRWDRWLQEAIVGSKARLDEAWLSTYLTSPLWRFVLPSGVIGGATWAGVLMPSVDRVGRYFPLTLVGEFDPGLSVFHLASAGDAWFGELEQLALETLEVAALDLDELGAAVAGSAGSLPVSALGRRSYEGRDEGNAWVQPINGPEDLCGGLADWVQRSVPTTWGPPSLWWSRGSTLVPPQWRLVNGLPAAEAFTAMLGDPAAAPAGPLEFVSDSTFDPASTLVREAREPPRWCSNGVSHVGHVRTENQDAFLERPDVGLWAVADGMGGHRDGAVASRMVVEAIGAAIEPRESAGFEARCAAVKEALTGVNAALRERARVDPVGASAAGSTVVVVMVDGARGVVLWAGDSRVYLWRSGQLVRLTIDHAECAADGTASGVITRAVGGEDHLELDERRFDLQAGDRLLLCSDGVHVAMDDQALDDAIGQGGGPDGIAARIHDAVLAGAAADNLTALVVCAEGSEPGR